MERSGIEDCADVWTSPLAPLHDWRGEVSVACAVRTISLFRFSISPVLIALFPFFDLDTQTPRLPDSFPQFPTWYYSLRPL